MSDPNSRDSRRPQDRLLIKVILPNQGVEGRVRGGGAEKVPFRPVDAAFRRSLSARSQALRAAVVPVARKLGAAPARVQLIRKALAKSHRPETLFSDQTCPIVGAGRLGELFIRVTPSGLNRLDEMIRDGTSKSLVKELSSVETIEPIVPADRRRGYSADDIIRRSPKTGDGYVVKVQLFDLGTKDNKIEEDFREQCASAMLPVQRRGYSSKSDYFEATCNTAADVETISKIVGVRSVRQMPVFAAVRSVTGQHRPFPESLPLPAGPLAQYPVVAVVDSGIRDDIPALASWIIGRHSTVAPAYENVRHGTFVAGLVAFPGELNPGLTKQLDSMPCALLDVQVIPNGDPEHGDVDHLLESALLQDLESVLQEHANEVRVWNLSLGTDERCSLDSFSSLAVELDRLQEDYGVSFVISAGNYDDRPGLHYPRTQAQLDLGRITSPADSVLGITVGSVAHVGLPKTGPLEGEPSPFSRHGAGPNFIIKPDLVHYGGTCRPDGTTRTGVRSIVEGGEIADGCGTSFSTPLVSRALATIYHQVTPTPTRELARAILTHQARDPRNGDRVPDQEENFLGFGLPTPTPLCLHCEPWMSTLVFEDTLRPGYHLEWDQFPYPPSLSRGRRYFGEIWMTLAFAPARSASWGSEYCETHVDAHFGVYQQKRDKDTGLSKLAFSGLVPPEHKNRRFPL